MFQYYKRRTEEATQKLDETKAIMIEKNGRIELPKETGGRAKKDKNRPTN